VDGDKTDPAFRGSRDPLPYRLADIEHLCVEEDSVLWRKRHHTKIDYGASATIPKLPHSCMNAT
jgi:hypothetical protein